jgi:hypothetical protein
MNSSKMSSFINNEFKFALAIYICDALKRDLRAHAMINYKHFLLFKSHFARDSSELQQLDIYVSGARSQSSLATSTGYRARVVRILRTTPLLQFALTHDEAMQSSHGAWTE